MPRATSKLALLLALAPAGWLSACQPPSAAPLPLAPAALAAVTAQADVPREPLARSIDAMFADRAAGETRAVVIFHNGRLIAERYAPPYGPATRMVGWSMSKSITGVLIGLLVADGRLRLDAPAPVALWQRAGDPRGDITLRQLLQMRSGLANHEVADPLFKAETTRMLFLEGRDDMAGFAEGQPLVHPPGSVWQYSTATTTILSDIATRALTNLPDPEARRRAMAEFARTRLFEPAGLHSASAEYDAAGTLMGGSMIHMTARDWARFGELLRNGGTVHGAQVVPRNWVKFMMSPAPRNPAYGAQLWRNVPRPDGHVVLLPGRAPASMVACLGHLGQYVLVSPAQHLTVVRLGHTPDSADAAVLNRLAAIVAQFPASGAGQD